MNKFEPFLPTYDFSPQPEAPTPKAVSDDDAAALNYLFTQLEEKDARIAWLEKEVEILRHEITLSVTPLKRAQQQSALNAQASNLLLNVGAASPIQGCFAPPCQLDPKGIDGNSNLLDYSRVFYDLYTE